MFPSEMVVLLAIALPSDSGRTLLNRPMDIMNEYIGSLYNSLVRRGYLTKKGSKRYKLTSLGRDALTEFLNDNRAQIEDISKVLQQLGIESSHDIEEALSSQ